MDGEIFSDSSNIACDLNRIWGLGDCLSKWSKAVNFLVIHCFTTILSCQLFKKIAGQLTNKKLKMKIQYCLHQKVSFVIKSKSNI